MEKVTRETWQAAHPGVSMDDGLCYCQIDGTGHVHAGPVSGKVWAKGILAIHTMVGYGGMIQVPARSLRKANAILRKGVK